VHCQRHRQVLVDRSLVVKKIHCTMADNVENGSGSTTTTTTTTASKVAVQMTRMRDANAKYKNLLKMAKERIEQQEEELKRFRGKIVDLAPNERPFVVDDDEAPCLVFCHLTQ
jgi:hypothetical protein